jgi:D-alanyl-D-alanine carboxypeptidase
MVARGGIEPPTRRHSETRPVLARHQALAAAGNNVDTPDILAADWSRMHSLALSLLITFIALPSTGLAATPTNAEIEGYTKALLEQAIPDTSAPGISVLIAGGDEVLFRGARGAASIELGVPLSPDHVFRLGSITKQFAAAAVLKLMEDGKLSLDDSLTKFVPDYPAGDDVTVRMLLNHTSGIMSYTEKPGLFEGPIRMTVTTTQLIDTFKNEKPDFAPGEDWNYNNSGYVLVGAVIEAASGMAWHAYLKQAFFEPLGMKHTGYGDETVATIPGHVTGYTVSDDKWAVAPYLSMTQPHAAGALVSSVDDLLRWNRALHEGKVLKPASYQQMITPIGKAMDKKYGFGISHETLRGQEVLQHDGGINGFGTALIYLPEYDLTVAALCNADSSPPESMDVGTVARLLAAYAVGTPYPEKKAIPVEIAVLEGYEGVYRIDQDSAHTVRVFDGKLTSQLTNDQARALVPVAKDVFLFENGLSRIIFARNNAGTVTAIRFIVDDEGEGTLIPRSGEPVTSDTPQ